MPPSDEQKNVVTCIVAKLAMLGHEVSWAEPITEGPLVTTYRFLPRSATKVAQITSCAQDLAMALKVEDVMVRRLPGEAYIGVSVPNKSRTMVLWRDSLAKDANVNTAAIPLNFGVDTQGKPFRDDLSICPHLLIAGSTFGGKSVLLNSLIASLIYWRTPDQIRFALSDTKAEGGLEFNHYRGSPFLLHEPANTMFTTWELMDWLADEADDRLREIARSGCQNIQQYNTQRFVKEDFDPLAYWVLVIDELADIMGGEKRGENKIANAKLGRIVQKARAAGIHVIAATQRSSVDIIKGVVKNNFPARLTFKLSSDTDSRTILDQGGADHLLPRGDMLYKGPGAPAVKRLHSAYASLDDIKQMVDVSRLRYA